MSTIQTTTVKANTLLHSDGSTTTQPSIPALDQRMAKAWCRWSQGDHVIDGSYGVSSITDQGVGFTQVAFSTALSSGNHATMLADNDYGNSFISGHTATKVDVRNMNQSNGGYADALMNVVVFGS